jgi:sec-independent protein translocase protein TatA
MYGFGHLWELVVLLLLGLVVFGPKRLPEIGAGLGKGIRGFRKSMADLKEETGIDEVQQDVKKSIADLKEDVGIDEMRRDVRKGIADLREESGIDEVRRELSSLNTPPR